VLKKCGWGIIRVDTLSGNFSEPPEAEVGLAPVQQPQERRKS